MNQGYAMPMMSAKEFSAAKDQICSCAEVFTHSIGMCANDPGSSSSVHVFTSYYENTCTGYKWGAWGWKYGAAIVLAILLGCSICCCIQLVFCGRICCCRCGGGKSRGLSLESDEDDSESEDDS